jgi:phosphoesterase RecJ-like protein
MKYVPEFKEAYKKIKQADNILLVTHNQPDGDALSSVASLAEVLEQINKKYSIYCYNQPPAVYSFLPHIEKINSDKNTLNFNSYDLIIVLDCGSLSRTKLETEIKNKQSNQFIIEFDHHPRVDFYADLSVKDSGFAATAELVYFFLKTNQIKINKNIANCILTGLMTDTGNFLYPSTSSQTIKIAAEMLKLGARYPVVLEKTWRNKSLAGLRIWGQAMSRLQVNRRYNIAFTVLTQKDLTDNGVSEEELEGIAGFLSNLYGVKALLFLREKENNQTKGSLRTIQPEIDVSLLARLLGGGGHRLASAFLIFSRLVKTEKGWQVID